MHDSRFQRWLPLTGIAFVVAMVAAFAIAGSSPDSDATDAKIVKYLADDSHFDPAVTSLILLWVASVLLLGFWAVLRRRLRAAEGNATGGAASLVFGAGVAGVVFNAVGTTIFSAPALAAHDARKGHATLSPSIVRFTQDVGYPIWIMWTIIGALAAWGTAAVVWRTRMWGRWYAWVSIVIGVVSLLAIEFYPVGLFALWIALTSVMMIVKPVRAAVVPQSRPAPSPAPAMT